MRHRPEIRAIARVFAFLAVAASGTEIEGENNLRFVTPPFERIRHVATVAHIESIHVPRTFLEYIVK
jgi:hypothetical protein